MDCVVVPMNGKCGEGKRVIIDPEHVALVMDNGPWYLSVDRNGIGYARSSKTGQYLHRLVFGWIAQGHQVDHVNRDTLDNRSSNLRAVTHQNNLRNRSGWGVSRFKGLARRASGRWTARIKSGETTMNLGTFDSELEAARAYDRAASHLFGEHARLNEPMT